MANMRGVTDHRPQFHFLDIIDFDLVNRSKMADPFNTVLTLYLDEARRGLVEVLPTEAQRSAGNNLVGWYRLEVTLYPYRWPKDKVEAVDNKS